MSEPPIAGSPADRLALLRAVPAAGPVLGALDGEDGVHVVGGAVRDLLLGRTPAELDLVVEGDALAVAWRAADRLGGVIVAHPRFGTATVRAGEVAFDLAGSRSETYPRPGALPDVRLGVPLADDLARRDFTVNAIALRLADGGLTAWPDALEDLSAARLRVLHDRSFADDPTRLLRLARYAGRLGFTVEDRTAALAADAVAGEAIGTVTGERTGAELRLLAREPQPAALLALEALGAGAVVLGHTFAVDPDLVDAALAAAPPDARHDLVALAAAVRVREADERGGVARPGAQGEERGEEARLGGRRAARAALAARLRALAFPAAEATAVVAAATVERLRPALERATRPSQVDAVLRSEPPEVAALAAALSLGPPNAVAEWLASGRDARLAITGHDLVAAGLRGPAVGAGLAAARAALLDGEADTAEAQRAAALSEAERRAGS